MLGVQDSVALDGHGVAVAVRLFGSLDMEAVAGVMVIWSTRATPWLETVKSVIELTPVNARVTQPG